MNITDALYRAVHDYPGGSECLAPRMGMRASSLDHKVSPTYLGAHCSPDDMARIMEFTGDHGALQALGLRLGYALLHLAKPDAQLGPDFVHALSTTVREFGEFISEASTNLADGRVSDNELRRIERELADMMAAAQALYGLAARINRDAKPASDNAPGSRP